MSDRRVKEDIKQVGETNDGQPIYRFKYKGEDQTQIGLIAQDVEKSHPEAVGSMGGIKTVDYKKATDGAVERADGGGVYPNSMGGVVSPSTVGEAFERGGYAPGGLVDPNDISALLASQRESFGPFAPAGLQGGSPHAPLYGGKGVVPPGKLPTSKLMVAGKAPAAPQSQVGSIYDGIKGVSGMVKDVTGKGLGERAGQALGLKDEGRTTRTNERPLTVSPVEGKPGTGVAPAKVDVAAPEVALEKDPSMFDSVKESLAGLFRAEGGGVMSRAHYSVGGSNPYEQTDDPMKDVIEDQEKDKTPELLKPAAPPSPMPSVMGDIINGVKTAASLYAMSDERIKKNKEQIGKLYDGQPVYRYDFGDDRTQIGLMAQEVQRHNPDAVATHNSGVKMVNYDRATEDAAKRGKFAMGGVMPRAGYEEGGPIDPEDLERGPVPLADRPAAGASDASAPAASAGFDVERAMRSIARNESAGEKEPYRALGPVTKSGDRGHGMYQVMGANIPSWSQEVLGQKLTPAQFLDDPEAQRKIAAAKLTQAYEKYGSPEQAASVWFTGQPIERAGNRQDILGTTNPAYVQKFANSYYGEGNAPPRPPADVTGREPKPEYAPRTEGEGSGGVKGFWKDNQGIILPILSGLGSMAESKSPFLAGALLSGVGGAARSYAEINKQLAETSGIEATTASTSMDVIRKTLSPNQEWVWAEGRWMPIMEAYKLSKEGKLKIPGGELADKAIASAADRYTASIKGNIPKAGEVVKPETAAPSEPKPKEPPAPTIAVPVVDNGVEAKPSEPGKPVYSAVPPPVLGSKTFELAKNEIDSTIGPGKEGALARSSAYQASTLSQAEAARRNTINANEMAMAVSNHIGGKGIAAPGSFFPARKELLNFGNTLARGIGGNSVSPAVTYADMMDKVNVLSAAERAKGGGFEAQGSLAMLSRAEPNTKMDPDAQAQLAAQAMVYNRAAKERELHRIGYQKVAGTNTSVDAGTAFEADNRGRYNTDVNLLKHAILYYPREMKAMATQQAKPEQIEKFFYDIARRNKLTYYPGASGYFVEGQ
jgi:hypothetical protein